MVDGGSSARQKWLKGLGLLRVECCCFKGRIFGGGGGGGKNAVRCEVKEKDRILC